MLSQTTLRFSFEGREEKMGYLSFDAPITPEIYEIGFIDPSNGSSYYTMGDVIRVQIPRFNIGTKDTYQSNQLVTSMNRKRIINGDNYRINYLPKTITFDDYIELPIKFENLKIKKYKLVLNSEVVCTFMNRSFARGFVIIDRKNIIWE